MFCNMDDSVAKQHASLMPPLSYAPGESGPLVPPLSATGIEPKLNGEPNGRHTGKSRHLTTLDKYQEGSKRRKQQFLDNSSRWKEHCATADRKLLGCTIGTNRVVMVSEPASSNGGLHVNPEGYDKVHLSRTVYLLKNVLFCGRCGYYMVHKTQSLTSPCKGCLLTTMVRQRYGE